MKTIFCQSILLIAAIALATEAGQLKAADSPGYKFIKEIPIGGEGSWDYLSIDPAARRLYVSHSSKVVVVDIDKYAVVGEIPDTPGVHGVAIAADLNRGFSSNGREAKVSMVELDSLKLVSKIETGQNPDCIIYNAGQHEVYAFNGRDGSATVIDAKSGNVVATISLPGKPEFAAADAAAGRVYNNLEDKSLIAVIDAKEHKVLNTWSIAPGEEASGMAIDTEHHRLFIGCHNKLMEMIDTESGKVVASVAIGTGVDANAFDAGTQLAFSSNGDGTVTIAHEDGPDKLTVVQTLATGPRMRTMALDTKTHRIFLAAAKFEAQPAQTGGGRQRPKIIPDTFKIMVYGIEK
jgi:DNA-binding beta-propeller fold protein YncE